MTTDLWMLLAAVGLYWVQILSAAVPNIVIKGVPWAIGPRDQDGKETPPWAHRLKRASDNMQENLVVFGAVVLVVHAAGAANDTSALGTMVFLGARVAHPVLYVVGIPGLRTAAWTVGVIGTAMAAWPLFG